jgi:quercetin dioxygenase-like cupin family protein
MSGYSVLPAGEALWRPARMTGILNSDLAGQLGGADTLGARLWRLRPGEEGPAHHHTSEHELYLVLDGTGRMRIGDRTLELDRLSAVLVEPGTVRQLVNDGDADVLWLVVGAPPEHAAQYP